MNHPEEITKTSPNCIIKWVLKERQHRREFRRRSLSLSLFLFLFPFSLLLHSSSLSSAAPSRTSRARRRSPLPSTLARLSHSRCARRAPRRLDARARPSSCSRARTAAARHSAFAAGRSCARTRALHPRACCAQRAARPCLTYLVILCRPRRPRRHPATPNAINGAPSSSPATITATPLLH